MSVSGDFFEVLKLSDTSVGVFICDVMGHGVRAALVASTVSALVGQLRDYLGDPGELLSRLNRALRSTLEYIVRARSLLRPFICTRIWRKANCATRMRDIPILCAFIMREIALIRIL